MAGISVTISGNSSNYEQALERSKRASESFSRDVGKIMARGSGFGFQGIHSGWTQIIHSMRASFDSIASGAPISRVMAQQIPQIAQGLVLLGNKVPGLGLLIKYQRDSATAAEEAAATYVKAAEAANIQALSSARKAEALRTAFMNETLEGEAALESAVAAEGKALADADSAAALRAKALAASEAAAAQRAEAGAAKLTIGPLGVIAGIIAGIAIGAYAAYKQTSKLIDKLSGIKPPDFKAEYIAKHNQKVNQGLEIQKEITKEIEKQVEAYNSASKAAERQAKQTKEYFRHLREMNNLSTKPQLEKDLENNALNSQERRHEIANAINERTNLTIEGKAKQALATGILTGVSSKEADQQKVNKNKAYLDAADKAMAELESAKNPSNPLGISKSDLFKGYNAMTNSGVSGADLDAAEKKIRTDRAQYEKNYRESVDKMAANDEVREKGSRLAKESAESLGKAAEISKDLPEMFKNAKSSDANAKEELKQKARAVLLGDEKSGTGRLSLTENQKHGAFSLGSMLVVDLNRQQLREQQIANDILRDIAGKSGGIPGFNAS